MAIVHLSGTKLAPKRVKAPLNRRFMYAMGFTFIIAMHLYVPGTGITGLELTSNAILWIPLAAALGMALYQSARNRAFRYTKLTIALFISCLMMTLPVIYPNASVNVSFTRLAGLWAGWLLFFMLQQFSLSNRHKQRLLWFIVLAVVIEAAIAYLQYLLPESLKLPAFFPASHLPYGTFLHSDVMASFLATGLVLSGYLLARQQRKYGQRLSRTTLLYIMPLITLPLITALMSVTGWIGAVIGVLFVIPYLRRFSTQRRLFGWLAFVLLGFSAGTALVHITEHKNVFLNKPVLENPVKYTLPQAKDMFIEKPFTGYGYGRFEPEYILYTARQHQLNNRYPPGLPSLEHPYNEFLYWGVEGGLLPLLGIALAATFVLAKLVSVRKGTRLAIFSLFLPVVIHSQSGMPFYHSSIHWISFIILLFWLDQRSANYKTYQFSSYTRFSLRITSLILPVVITCFMATGIHTGYLLNRFENTNQPVMGGLINPVIWKERLEWNQYSAELKSGIEDRNNEKIQSYIDWSLKTIRNQPREKLYRGLVLAYLATGEDIKAEQIRTEAKYLFPRKDFSDIQLTSPNEAGSATEVANEDVQT